MTLWFWVFVVLTAIALVLVVSSAMVVLRRVLRMRARIDDLQGTRLAVSLRGLESQSARLTRLSQSTAPLVTRAHDAAREIQEAGARSKLPEARAALQQAGTDIAALVEELR